MRLLLALLTAVVIITDYTAPPTPYLITDGCYHPERGDYAPPCDAVQHWRGQLIPTPPHTRGN